MNIGRTLTMVGRDLRLGTRSPIFVWTVVMPIGATLLIQLVLLTLLSPTPRLGIADLGASQITATAGDLERIELTRAPDARALKELVRNNDVDVGLVLPEGFDAAVRAGERPALEFYVAGESLASNRIILGITTLDLVREVEGKEPPVQVVLNVLGERPALPIAELLVLLIVVFVLVASSIFVPAFMLVDERERRTLTAVLVTPATMSEVLLSKAILGVMMAVPMGVLTLALNGALPEHAGALLATLAVGAVICIEVGLIYGTAAKDARTLFTLIKTLNVLLFGPVVFYVFPEWPQWIAKTFPTYWFIDPLYRIAIESATLADVWPHLAVATGVAAVLVVPVVLLGRRMQQST